jgi:hypothetical protein
VHHRAGHISGRPSGSCSFAGASAAELVSELHLTRQPVDQLCRRHGLEPRQRPSWRSAGKCFKCLEPQTPCSARCARWQSGHQNCRSRLSNILPGE